LGIKWRSTSSLSSFIELRIYKECNVTWIYSLDGVELQTPLIPLGDPSNCGNGIEHFLTVKFIPENNNIKLEGTYNDAKLPPITIDNSNGDLNSTTFNFDVIYADFLFNYVLIAETQ